MDWQRLQVAPDGTHHVHRGAPAYPQRFEQVLKFHSPGLAPVRADGLAWHIGANGEPAYPRRFLQTLGFYGGLAAVQDSAGWFHIDPVGDAVYPEKHAWCGNFQEGLCPVRLIDGRYAHIQPDGQPVTGNTWAYAGDYRDGIAVVQRNDGLSSHIDLQGELVHDQWLLDLDVFHKGFARARDAAGWFHLDRSGSPAYQRRFAMVEPFYNGQARVETHEGSLEVIDERGNTVLQLRPPRVSDVDLISKDMVGFWRSEAIFAAVECGLMDQLPVIDHKLGDREPSKRKRRLLAALGELGLVEFRDGNWIPTARGALLQRDSTTSMREAALHWSGAGRIAWASLGDMLDDANWRPPRFFEDIATAGTAGPYQEAMRPYALNDYIHVPRAISSSISRIVDLGGGTGALARILVGARPDIAVAVVDRPEVIALVEKAAALDRVNFTIGDLFEGPLPAGDAYVLARVLHDWDDADAVRILRHAREYSDTGTKLFVVEMIKPEVGFRGALLDLHMLLATGGRERTLPEYTELLSQAGWHVSGTLALPAVSSVIVAEAK